MSYGKKWVVPQAVQAENLLQLGTTVVRFYQYILDLSKDNPEASPTAEHDHTTVDDVIQTLEQFTRDLNARNLTIPGPLLFPELCDIVRDCKRDCESLRNRIQTWLQLFPGGCVSRVGPGSSPSLSDIVTKSNRCKTNEPGIRTGYLEDQQRAIKELMDINQYAQAN